MELRCVKGHDLCYLGTDPNCPYCERGTTMNKPTCEDFMEETLLPVYNGIVDTWRWGTVREEVCLREEDGTYWRATYRVSSDGETNELRQGEAEIEQVRPEECTITRWIPI